MKKVLLALVMMGFFYLQATAKKAHHKPGKKLSAKKVPAKDTVVMNFKICKGDGGYAICGETPGANNSTYPQEPKKPVIQRPVYEHAKTDMIILKSIPETPKVKFPLDKPGPETQSGAWVGVSSWNGVW